MSVRLLPAALEEIRGGGATAYPYEGCGALLGRSENGTARVVRTLALPNVEAAAPRVRFAVSPRDYLHAEAEAERLGLHLLGFWHSHPDHPARPSPTDREYAWEGLLTLVLAVAKGEPRELTAWEVHGPDAPFVEIPIALEENREQE
jgi:proteasome lid subunit RPN8/RPN11